MHRAGLAFVAALVAISFIAGSVPAAQTPQTPQAPPMKSVLAGKTFTPPLKGQAEVEYASPVTRREKDLVVTRITVKNVSASPIGRLTIGETWYDKAGAVLTGGKGTINGLLQPGEVQIITIETPFKPGMNANNYIFSHANGTVSPKRVPKLEVPKPTDATPAAATKK